MAKNLSEKQKQAIYLLVHKKLNKDDVARKIGVAKTTIYSWFDNEKFVKAYKNEFLWIDMQKSDALLSKARSELCKLVDLLNCDDVAERIRVSKIILEISSEATNSDKRRLGYE